MRFAVPVNDGVLSMHFGHCKEFAIIDVSPETSEIVNTTMMTPPPHEPGVLPKWLGEHQVNTIIAGGMGQRAQNLFAAQNIDVVTGAPAQSPQELVRLFTHGKLECGQNVCDH